MYRLHLPLEVSNSVLTTLAKVVKTGYQHLNESNKNDLSKICQDILKTVNIIYSDNPLDGTIPEWSVSSYLGVSVKNITSKEIGHIDSVGYLSRKNRIPVLNVFSSVTSKRIYTITSLRDLHKNFEILTPLYESSKKDILHHSSYLNGKYGAFSGDFEEGTGSVELDKKYTVGEIGMLIRCAMELAQSRRFNVCVNEGV